MTDSNLTSSSHDVNLRFYVYLHRKKTDSSIFYVGKGQGNRAWDTGKGRRNNPHWQHIVNKHGVDVEIAQDGLSESDAFLLEMWLIAKFRHEGLVLTNLTDGGDGTTGFIHNEDNLAKMSAVQSGKNNPRYLKNLHLFYHPDHGVYLGTRYDFKSKFGVSDSGVRRLILGQAKTAGGWRYGGESSLSEPSR